MGPLEEIRKQTLMELVNALRPFAGSDSPEQKWAATLVEKWDHAFNGWGWTKEEDFKEVEAS